MFIIAFIPSIIGLIGYMYNIDILLYIIGVFSLLAVLFFTVVAFTQGGSDGGLICSLIFGGALLASEIITYLAASEPGPKSFFLGVCFTLTVVLFIVGNILSGIGHH